MKAAGAAVMLLLVIATGVLYSQTSGKKPPVRKAPTNEEEIIQEVRELEDSLRNSFIDGKTIWWEKHLDAHYIGLNADGRNINKERAIELYGSDDVKYEEIVLSDISARIFNGDCVLDTGRTSVKGSYKGQDFSGDYYFVNIWIKQGTDWKLASSQSTKLPGP